jgi:hypothetical protein
MIYLGAALQQQRDLVRPPHRAFAQHLLPPLLAPARHLWPRHLRRFPQDFILIVRASAPKASMHSNVLRARLNVSLDLN